MDAMLGRLNDRFFGVEQDGSSTCFDVKYYEIFKYKQLKELNKY